MVGRSRCAIYTPCVVAVDFARLPAHLAVPPGSVGVSMFNQGQSREPDRRLVLASGLACLLVGSAAHAQPGPLTREKLENLIKKALAEPGTTPISRPRILGFVEDKLTTRSIERGDAAHKYGFMVVTPRHADGLVMFEGRAKPIYFVMHRTDLHMRRVASAINRGGKLSGWSGAEADASFASHLSFWASVAESV